MQNTLISPKIQHNNKTTKKMLLILTLHIVLILLLVVILAPFAIMVLKSLMTIDESMDVPIVIFPKKLLFSNWAQVFDKEFLIYFRNTLVVLAVNLIAIPLSSSMCAFGFSRLKFAGRNFWFAVTLATIMLPSVVVAIPLFVMYVQFGWLNTLYPMTIPSFFGGGAMNIFLIRQFMKSIPQDMDNAARIDGASRFRIYATIVMPLCLPVITLILINTFNGVWNDFMGPLLYLRKKEVFTLGIGIYKKFPNYMTEGNFPNYQMAAGVLMVIPPAILFFVFQRQLIEGIQIGGVKG